MDDGRAVKNLNIKCTLGQGTNGIGSRNMRCKLIAINNMLRRPVLFSKIIIRISQLEDCELYSLKYFRSNHILLILELINKAIITKTKTCKLIGMYFGTYYLSAIAGNKIYPMAPLAHLAVMTCLE